MSNNMTLLLYTITILMSVILGAILHKYNEKAHMTNIKLKLNNLQWSFDRDETFRSSIKLLLSFLPFILVSGFRYNTGADYVQYTWNFNKIADWEGGLEALAAEWREPGFALTAYISSKLFGSDPSCWFMLTAGLTFYILSLALCKSRSLISIEVFSLLFGCYVYLHTFNYVRQLMAAMLILLAIIQLGNRKRLQFLLFCLLASSIHLSSLIFILVYVLYSNRKAMRGIAYRIIVIFSPILMGFIVRLIGYIPIFRIYISRYFNRFTDLGIGWLVDVIPILLINIIQEIDDRREDNIGVFLTDLSWLIILVRPFSYYAYAAGRLFIDFGLFAIVGYAINYKSMPGRRWKNILVAAIFIAYFVLNFYVYNNSGVYPYTSVFASR